MFATQALRPTGAHAGVVGEWRATVTLAFPDEPARPAEVTTATYQFRDDGTFTATGAGASATTAIEQGSYHQEAPGVFELIATGGTIGRTLQMIDDDALVFPTRIFQRK